MNIIIVGPCGVGKSKVSELFAREAGLIYLDFDKIRSTKKSLPCFLNELNILECLSPEINEASPGFVLDIGGGTVFQPKFDNDNRLEQIVLLKKTYFSKIVMLIANQNILFERYKNTKKDISSKNQTQVCNNFKEMWNNWLVIEQPYWQRCAEKIIDTSAFNQSNTIEKIIDWYKNEEY